MSVQGKLSTLYGLEADGTTTIMRNKTKLGPLGTSFSLVQAIVGPDEPTAVIPIAASSTVVSAPGVLSTDLAIASINNLLAGNAVASAFCGPNAVTVSLAAAAAASTNLTVLILRRA